MDRLRGKRPMSDIEMEMLQSRLRWQSKGERQNSSNCLVEATEPSFMRRRAGPKLPQLESASGAGAARALRELRETFQHCGGPEPPPEPVSQSASPLSDFKSLFRGLKLSGADDDDDGE